MEVYAMLILAGLMLTLALLFMVMNNGRQRRLPPGPTGLSLYGSLLKLARGDAMKLILELSETYGPVMSLGEKSVFLLGYDVLKEALVDQAEDFTGRAPHPFFIRYTGGY
ncbi:hypothetical protein LDENG_00147610, partial [Lucifuga dentata]